MQSRKDTGLRAIVENVQLPTKVRREALALMDAPSRLFLTRLINDESVPAKLRLDATRRLPAAERRISEGKIGNDDTITVGVSASVKAGVEPRPATGSSAYILDDETKKLLGRKFGDPKPISESATPEPLEVPHAAAPAPTHGPSNEYPSNEHPQYGQTEAERNKDLADRIAAHRRGKELAARTIVQYERCTRAPFNLEESWLLEGLQKEFSTWESEVKTKWPDWDTRAEFLDNRLRRYERRMTTNDFARARRSMRHFVLPEPVSERKPDFDDGIWSGMPRGVQ